jgi:sigma-B regulation protein RsbU (phosphoserine phosphatase)
MNDKLLEVADERFVTAFYGVLNRRTRVFRYANAGHPYPFCFRQGTGEVTPLAAQGFMLGIIPGEMYSERAVVLNPGDTLCFYTDGLVEARNEIGEQYGDDRLTRCLRNFATGGPAPLLQEILACQKRFCSGVPLADDLTVALCQLAVE